MACGRPVVAVNATGHADTVNSSNALVINTKGEVTIKDKEEIPIARWPEPDLDDAIDKLEWTYQNRDKLRALGRQAGQDLFRLTWRKTAETLRNIIHETCGTVGIDHPLLSRPPGFPAGVDGRGALD